MDKILRYYASLEVLLESIGGRAQMEQERLEACPVQTKSPLELFLDRAYLLVVIEKSIRDLNRALRANRTTMTDDVQGHLKVEIQRRKQFVSWLKADTGPQQYMAIYPISQYDEQPRT